MSPPITQNFASFSCSPDDQDINNNLQRFWELEAIPNQSLVTSEEQQAEDHFVNTHRCDINGRFIVRLPVKPSINQLGESKSQALKRFNYLERKLNADPNLKSEYKKFMNEYIELEHMIEVNEDQDPVNNQCFYLPHHAVIKLSSSTTQTRVVFDASAKSSSGISLNDTLMVGPTIQDDLFSIMIRSRKYQLMFTADIPKMYRQINVDRRDTHLQRILWRNTPEESIKTYELTTVTYGTAAAPFLATRTLHQLALDERKQFPIAADIIINDFYVDDVITGADTLEELNAIKQQLVSLLALGGFNLHKWSSNCEKLLKTIPKPLHETLKCHGLSYAEAIKTLSLYWQPKSDQLLLNISTLNQHPSFTKKTVLSDISKLFDPLGFAAPVVINGKMFMQSLWQHKIAWKDTLNDQLKEQWLMLRKDLPTLNDMAFNRCCLVKGSTKIQLLGFADASEKAFGACVYIRSQNNDNQVEVQLLTSKSRVAPLLTESIPRLELCAALLLSQLIEKVITAIKIPFDGIILWSDSTIALSWMLTEPYKLKTFIAIRVYKIQHIKSNHNIVWKHVSSSDNPADLVSRGMSSIQYATCQLWWHGPSYLLQNEDMWPEKAIVHNTTTLPELKAETIAMVISTDVKEDFILITKYSNYQKMINITAFILRFIQNCRTDKLKRTQSLVCREILSTDELRRSKMKLVSLVQTTTFKADIKSLQKHGELPNNSIIKYLSGPYNIKQKYQRKDTQMKAYIVNFVCFVTKGTHLEIVLDLTAESFIQALKRFISRRLHPNSVWSDNATNFHGAYNIIMAQQQSVLNEKDHNHIMNLCATQNLEWKFIPARSPHFGGLWESSVKSFKSHFKKVINDTALTYEEMLTLINQIEAILNSRPITPMSNNPNDPLPLTPAHLMMGGPITALDEKLLINIPYNLINWQKITQMVQSFWTRYQKEYLHTLQQRKKWKTPTDNISIGDIVLLHEDNVPTNKWPIGCVINVFPGTDGNVRAAEVRILKEDNNSIKTKDNIFQYKTFTRAITKICKLSISED